MSALGAGALAVVGMAAPARAEPPPDYDFKWANIGDVDNAAYQGGGPYGNINQTRGGVGYEYRISKLEVTSGQWAEFQAMALRQNVNLNQYGLQPNFWGGPSQPMRAVIGLNWRAGAYYCNWLNNGKQESWQSCLSGAYDTSTFHDFADGSFSDQTAHSPGAKFWIPTLDEWMKAAFYDPNRYGIAKPGWWNYVYRSDSPPIPGPPPPGNGQTTGGWDPGGFEELTIPLGAYTPYTSAYGLWDLSGASREWLEEPVGLLKGRYTGRAQWGSYAGESSYNGEQDMIQGTNWDYCWEDGFYGFRIAGVIPAPPGALVLFGGIVGLSRRRRM